MLKTYLHLRFASSWACVDPDDLQAMPVESRRAPRRRTALAAAAEATASKIGRRFALGGVMRETEETKWQRTGG